MSEFYAERKRENRFILVWVILAVFSVAWVLCGDVHGLIFGGINAALAALEMAQMYTTIPEWVSEERRKMMGESILKRRGISFGEMMRGQCFDLRGYFRKIYLGFLPATVVSVIIVTVCCVRNGRSILYILAGDAVLTVVPVVMFLLYYESLQYRFTHELSFGALVARGSEALCCLLVLLALAIEFLGITDGYLPAGFRMALCFVDGRGETLYWWSTNTFDPEGGEYLLFMVILVCVYLMVTRRVRQQIPITIVLTAVIVFVFVNIKAFSYMEMSLDKVTVHNGFFDRSGTEYRLDNGVTDYVFAFWSDSGHADWTIHLYFEDGTSMEARCKEVFRDKYVPANDYRYRKDQNGKLTRYNSGKAICAATNRWLEQYETEISFTEALSERLSAGGAKGWIGFTEDIALLKPEEKEIYRRIAEKLPRWE